jgi:hypothetical protein
MPLTSGGRRHSRIFRVHDAAFGRQSMYNSLQQFLENRDVRLSSSWTGGTVIAEI